MEKSGTYEVVEFREQFSIQEEIRCSRQLIRDGVKKDFGTVVFVLLGCALFAFHGKKAEFEDIGAIAEEDCFSAYWDNQYIVSVFLPT